MTKEIMAKEVAELLVDNMNQETMEMYLKTYIEADFLLHPENYEYEAAEVEKLLIEEVDHLLQAKEIDRMIYGRGEEDDNE